MPELSPHQWLEIEDRYCATDDTISDIARDYGVSRTAINKRAKKMGWVRPVDPLALAVQQTDTARRIAAPRTKSDYQIAAFGKRTPENMQTAIRAFREGSPPSVVAPVIGMHRNTLDTWMKDDVEFAALAAQARADFLHDKAQTVNAASRTDGKLALALLERHPDTRDHYGAGQSNNIGGAGINITINVPIPQHVEAGDRPVIDVTPTDEKTPIDIAES